MISAPLSQSAPGPLDLNPRRRSSDLFSRRTGSGHLEAVIRSTGCEDSHHGDPAISTTAVGRESSLPRRENSCKWSPMVWKTTGVFKVTEKYDLRRKDRDGNRERDRGIHGEREKQSKVRERVYQKF
ncbi:hypothetical protein TIFTF001_006841 [Ficus carica]|uniref:Uncharacterized protein n=1 Tax=Ficus carica TaxID=3494 RepID=A0AA88DG24_FICCA|nr:hypothetical protein TIFTF001_006841 [Ficus carica]